MWNKVGVNEENWETQDSAPCWTDLTDEQIQERALSEFNRIVEKLQNIGVNVVIIEDTKSSDTPDSIFPNNWMSSHTNGIICLFPMFAENRRKERREKER